MNAMPHIDMADVLRLTRLGKLKEATAVLQSRLAGHDRGGHAASPTEPAQAPLLRDGALRPTGEPPAAPTRRTSPVAGFSLPKMRTGPHVLPVPDGARFERRSVRNAAGSLDYKLYVPATSTKRRMPLVVMLHGCTQDADDFAAGTRMNELAESHGFLVAYPEQTQAKNPSRCWNWFKSAEQARDRGEPSLIADATRSVIADFGVDPRRVFVAGLSAGGAAAAIMGRAYPDLYAGVGVHSGLACGAASDLPSALAAMRSGSRAAAGSQSQVPTIVFHGTGDRTVNAVNAEAVSKQALGGRSVDSIIERGRSADGTTYTRTIDRAPNGSCLGETWMIDGAGHAWSGGSPTGSYATPAGPDASREMLRFFGIDDAGSA